MLKLIGLLSLLQMSDGDIVEEAEMIAVRLELEAKAKGFTTKWASRPVTIKVDSFPRVNGIPVFIGVCTFSTPPTITLDRETWIKADFNFREMLVAHEIAHCKLFRPHDTRCRVDNSRLLTCYYPKSLMYPQLSATDYIEMRDYYLTELFSIVYDDYSALLQGDRKEGKSNETTNNHCH